MSGRFEQAEFGRYTEAELDAVMTERSGVLCCIGYGYTTRGPRNEPLAGGWVVQWVGTKGMGNYGTAVLVPTDARTRRLWREAKLRELEARGLKRQWAACLLDAKRFGGMLFEQAERVAAVLEECAADAGALRAMLDHPASYGSGSGRGEWWDRWAGVIPAAMATAPSRPREAALAEMVQHVLWTCRT